jgi:MOSC domain-containing protein YiiM
MQLQSVNIGKKQALQIGPNSVETGIFKIPTAGPVEITTNGVGGDKIADLRVHGGPDQAAYIYGGADYAWWSTQLGTDLEPGMFGENLTISDLESAPVKIGDRFRIGSVLLEATAPRSPCSKFATKMGDPKFVKRFSEGRRPGIYCRVIESGTVSAGDTVTLIPFDGETLTIEEFFDISLDSNRSEADIQRVLAAPVAVRDREYFEEQLQKLRQPSD